MTKAMSALRRIPSGGAGRGNHPLAAFWRRHVPVIARAVEAVAEAGAAAPAGQEGAAVVRALGRLAAHGVGIRVVRNLGTPMATTLTATMETYEAARSDATLRVQWEGSEQSVAWLEPNGEEAAGAFPEPLWSEDVHNSLSEWLGPEGKEPIVADDAEAARRRLQASRRACEWLCSEGETADVVGRMPSTPILDAAAEGVIGALAAIDRWRRRGQASLQELVAELRNGSTALTLRWETGGGRIRGAGLVHRTTESNGLETGRRRPMELRRGVIETRIEWRPVEGREEGELHGNAAGEAVRGLLAERDREWERETEEGLRTVATHRDAATRTRARAAGRTAEEEARWIGLEDEE